MNVEYKQRSYDNKWVEWTYMVDPEIDQEEIDELYQGKEMLIPKRWVATRVFDYMVEIA